MSQIHQVRSSARKGMMAGVLCLGLALSPGRALAGGCPVYDASANMLLAQMAGSLIAMIADIQLGFYNVQSAIGRAGTGIETAIQIQQDADVRRTQAEADAAYAISAVNRAAELAAEDPENIAAYTHMCRKVRSQQLVQNARAVSASMGRGIAKDINDFADRHQGEGNGPDYAKTMMAGRCGYGMSGAGGSLGPEDNPTNPNCLPQTGTQAERQQRIHADINVETIIPSIDKVPLEKPGAFNDNTQNVTPDQNDQAQLMFMLGRNFCYFVAGPSKAMPKGQQASTPEGLTKAATNATCKSLRSLPVDQCGKMLQYVTRPDCSNPANADICDQHHSLCADAVAAGILSGSTLSDLFGNCHQNNGEGLSPYQVEWINATKCLHSQEYVASFVSGAKTPEVMAAINECISSNLIWENSVLQRKSNLISALGNLNTLRGCE